VAVRASGELALEGCASVRPEFALRVSAESYPARLRTPSDVGLELGPPSGAPSH
jgi:hypothetical protein